MFLIAGEWPVPALALVLVLALALALVRVLALVPARAYLGDQLRGCGPRPGRRGGPRPPAPAATRAWPASRLVGDGLHEAY